MEKSEKYTKIKTFIPFGWCCEENGIPFSDGDWEEMDNADY